MMGHQNSKWGPTRKIRIYTCYSACAAGNFEKRGSIPEYVQG